MAASPQRATPAQRRQWVEEQFVAGKNTRAIERDGAAQFGCAKKTIRHDLAAVRRRLAEAYSAQSQDEVRAWSHAVLLDALTVAKEERDVSGMALVAQRVAEIAGAYKREVRIEATISGLAELFAEEKPQK